MAIIVALLLGTYFLGLAILPHLGTREETFSKKDRLAPPPPTLVGIPQATNSAKLTIKGFAEPGVTVTLFKNGNLENSQLASAEGQFVFENVTLESGENEIYARAKDPAGNESRPSATYKINVDRQPPQLQISEPEDNAVVKEERGRQPFVLIRGKVEERATVTVNGHQAIVREEGNFEYRLLLTKEGENTIKIVARDAAGNKTTIEKVVIYQKLKEGSEGES